MDNWLLLAAQVHRSASADVSLVRQVIIYCGSKSPF